MSNVIFPTSKCCLCYKINFTKNMTEVYKCHRCDLPEYAYREKCFETEENNYDYHCVNCRKV